MADLKLGAKKIYPGHFYNMAQGSKAAYTSKQKREARHIESGYKKKGRSSKTAERIAWATVNKQDGGGKKKKSKVGGRKKTRKKSSAKKKRSR